MDSARDLAVGSNTVSWVIPPALSVFCEGNGVPRPSRGCGTGAGRREGSAFREIIYSLSASGGVEFVAAVFRPPAFSRDSESLWVVALVQPESLPAAGSKGHDINTAKSTRLQP